MKNNQKYWAVRNENGSWELKTEGSENPELKQSHPSYPEALPRYVTALDRAFAKAQEKCEFEFLLALLRVRGIDYRGIGDAYETTLRSIPKLQGVHDKTEDFEAVRHLQLWIYGHIVEASEPYEILSNLINISLGGRFGERFYPHKLGVKKPETPSYKIEQIEKDACKAGIPEVTIPLKEIWDRNLRNAIFHSDYILVGGEVHTLSRIYTHDEIMTIVNRALVYHEAFAGLYKAYIQSYTEPKTISVHPEFSEIPEQKSVVIVRANFGIIGLKDAWTKDEIAKGAIPWRIGKFYQEEINLLESDPTLALLPERQNS